MEQEIKFRMALRCADNGREIPVRACAGCAALISSHQEFCGRCIYEGEPKFRHASRSSALVTMILQLIIHFPLMTLFRVGLYVYIGIPKWLWAVYVIETVVWFVQRCYGSVSFSVNEKRIAEARAKQEAARRKPDAENQESRFGEL